MSIQVITPPASTTISNGAIINGVANFWQSTPPSTRVNGSALIDGDIWNQTGKGTWIRKDIYWVSESMPTLSLSTLSISATNTSFTANTSGIIYVEKILAAYYFTDRAQTDPVDYWVFTYGCGNYGNANGLNNLGTVNSYTERYAAATYVTKTIDVGLVIVNPTLTTAPLKFNVTATKNGSLANRISLSSVFYYREVYQ